MAADIDWAGFTVVLIAAYLIPGPDLLIILRSSVRGWRSGVAAAVGAQSGLTVHMLLAVVGLSVLLTGFPAALTGIRLLGGLYLAALAVRLLIAKAQPGRPDRPGSGFRQGLLTNLLNPKVVLFFASVLPQFTVPGHPLWRQVLLLGVVDILFGFLPWALVIALGTRLHGLLERPGARRVWDRFSGLLLLAVSVWMIGGAVMALLGA